MTATLPPEVADLRPAQPPRQRSAIKVEARRLPVPMLPTRRRRWRARLALDLFELRPDVWNLGTCRHARCSSCGARFGEPEEVCEQRLTCVECGHPRRWRAQLAELWAFYTAPWRQLRDALAAGWRALERSMGAAVLLVAAVVLLLIWGAS